MGGWSKREGERRHLRKGRSRWRMYISGSREAPVMLLLMMLSMSMRLIDTTNRCADINIPFNIIPVTLICLLS